MLLDIRTSALISIGLSLFLAHLMYVLQKRSPDIKGPGYWVVNNLFNALGQITFLWFALSSDVSLIILSNFIQSSGLAFCIAGIWAFNGKRIRWKLLAVLVGLLTILTFVFSILYPNETFRRVSFSAIMFTLSFLGLIELFGPVSSGLKQAFRLNGYLLLLLCIALLVRAIFIVLYNQNEALASSVANNIIYAVLLFAQVGIAFGNMLMVNYRIAEDLTRLNEGKAFLFSILAHDLQGPMATIHRLMEFVDDEELTKEDRTVLLGELKKMTFNTHSLLENLLDWSLNESNSIKSQPENLHLAQVVNSALLLHSESAKIKGVEIETSIPEPTQVFADPKMLGTVFRNLVSNAIKFSNPGGVIRISSFNIENRVRILVEDNGIGISPEKLRILFSLSPSDIRKRNNGKGGTGLGLIICKRFIEKNKGSIVVKSENKHGTSIEILLPASA